MRYGDVELKDDGYHIKGPQSEDEKNLKKIFVIPRKTSEKFDCFLAFDNYFMKISSGLSMGRGDPLFLGIIQTHHAKRLSKFCKRAIGENRSGH